MAITKREIQLIADALSDARGYVWRHTRDDMEAPEEATALWAVETVVEFVARNLGENNPRLDRQKFIDTANRQ